ncbi:hypothetical protein P692DRAFT_20722063 [Suillus brevipes Sb2]|nr:hypothetical protein P692DRAFT_20722063 [Suillus brevipes Sb2]
MEPSFSLVTLLKGHNNWVQEVVFLKNADDLKVMNTSNDKTVRTWDIETGKKSEALTGYRSGTIGPDESIDGRKIVSGRRMTRLLYGMDRRRKSDLYSSTQ